MSISSCTRVSLIFGTRPEAIKLCPLVLALQADQRFEPHVCVTGQHKEMLQQVLDVFEIEPDANLELMRPNQTLAGLTARAITAVDAYLTEHQPEVVVVQGDTTTVFCAALCAFYHRIPVGHVEAGLRTWNKYSPFPEEINRVLASRMTDLHFAPTETARHNLLREGVAEAAIHVTGNTVIDALLLARRKVDAQPPTIAGLPEALQPGTDGPRVVLITGHRRESFGAGFESICQAIAHLAASFPDVHFVYPVHLNPNVREPVHRLLGGGQAANIHLIEPLGYLPFVGMMSRATLILTDSGGVQEEAPSLGKPVLVMRDTTERPEAVEMGTVKLVGADYDRIVEESRRLLTDPAAHEVMANAVNPYGDGKACQRIVEVFQQLTTKPVTEAVTS